MTLKFRKYNSLPKIQVERIESLNPSPNLTGVFVKSAVFSLIFPLFFAAPTFAAQTSCPKLSGHYRSCQTISPIGVQPDESLLIKQANVNGVTVYQFSYPDGVKISLRADGIAKFSNPKDGHGGKYEVRDMVECKANTLTWESLTHDAGFTSGRTFVTVNHRGELLVKTEYFNDQGAKGIFAERCAK